MSIRADENMTILDLKPHGAVSIRRQASSQLPIALALLRYQAAPQCHSNPVPDLLIVKLEKFHARGCPMQKMKLSHLLAYLVGQPRSYHQAFTSTTGFVFFGTSTLIDFTMPRGIVTLALKACSLSVSLK